MDQRDLAERISKTASYLARIESGTAMPSMQVAEDIATGLASIAMYKPLAISNRLAIVHAADIASIWTTAPPVLPLTFAALPRASPHHTSISSCE
jgi:transcriptional regulator with XRE-family HTH domain